MNITISNYTPYGIVNIPSSKSITHRAIICASFAQKNRTIINPLICNDTLTTINIFKQLGTGFETINNQLVITPNPKITEIDFSKLILDCQESATTFRFLMAMLSRLTNRFFLKAAPSLANRIKNSDTSALYPYQLTTDQESFIFEFNNISFDDHFSCKETSQFASGYALSKLFTDQDLVFKIIDQQIDPYLLTTFDVLKKFGYTIAIIKRDHYHITIKNNPNIESTVTSFTVEGDYSSASNFLAYGTSGPITIYGLPKTSCQADSIIFGILTQMNASFTISDDTKISDHIIIKTNRCQLTGIDQDISYCPDLGPILMGLCSVASGVSNLRGIQRLVNKESNRLKDVIEILISCGANIKYDEHSVRIKGKDSLTPPKNFPLINDHRIIMMLAILSPYFTKPLHLSNIECVEKSFPDFFEQFERAGGIISKV